MSTIIDLIQLITGQAAELQRLQQVIQQQQVQIAELSADKPKE